MPKNYLEINFRHFIAFFYLLRELFRYDEQLHQPFGHDVVGPVALNVRVGDILTAVAVCLFVLKARLVLRKRFIPDKAIGTCEFTTSSTIFCACSGWSVYSPAYGLLPSFTL